MSDAPIVVELGGPIAIATLNRPDKRNAMSLTMWRELPAIVHRIAAEPGVRALVLRGAGGNFCAGADIAEFETIYADRASAIRNQTLVQTATKTLEALPIPTIAAIEGACVGGGCGLALACDIRLAAASARFAITPAKLGLVYGVGDTRRLVEAVGLSTAKDMLFTGAMLDAPQALMCGLIDRLYETDAFPAGVQDFLDDLTAASGVSAAATKKILRRIAAGQRDDDDASLALFADALEAPDFQEGRSAFLEKRKPRFG
ncbi:MAG: enoyl-CoA hydratase/isomerase family protein [Hyphomonadaceae bacterium]|nr:enoyl-CoA hydratase/isomerase family protein [Hyphomonadaceae bacterium]